MWIKLKKKIKKAIRFRRASRVPALQVNSIEEGIKIAKRDLKSFCVIRLLCRSETYFIKKCTANINEKKPYSDLIECEKNNLIFLKGRGIPVPEVIMYDQDFLVLSDCGHDLREFFFSKDYDPEYGKRVCYEAGRALAHLHMKGISLGRGQPKDFCWNGENISFIDFKRSPNNYDADSNGPTNLLNFIYYVFKHSTKMGREGYSEAQSFLTGYLEAADSPPISISIRPDL